MKKIKFLAILIVIAIFGIATVACGDAQIKIDSVTVRAESQTVYTGGTLTLTADVSPTAAEDKSVVWSIESGASATEATVSHTGIFSAGYVAGTCVVRATSQADSSVYGTFKLTVEEPREAVPVTGISIDGDETRWAVIGSETINLTATVRPANADNKGAVWSVIDDGDTQATVTADGVLTLGTQAGDVVVKVVSAENPELTDTVTVRIAPALTGIALSGNNEIAVGDTARFAVESQPVSVDPGMYAWTISETDLADGEYTFSEGVFTSDVAGYAVISVCYKANERVSATAVININYSITTRYTVTFTDENDKVLNVQRVAKGESAQAPEYIVLGKEVSWNKAFDNIVADLTVKAVLSNIEYTVSYCKPASDGVWETISVNGATVQNVAFGETAVAPDPNAYAIDGKLFLNWRIEKEGNAYTLYAEYKDISV